jgi:hypothetical protein
VYSFYLPFLYSCVSIVGVLLLLLCTPFGFVRLFTLVGEFVTKPQFLRDIEEEHNVARYRYRANTVFRNRIDLKRIRNQLYK